MADDNTALILAISANLKQFENAFKKAHGVIDAEGNKIEKRGKRMAKTLEESVGKTDIGGALRKVFDSSRLKVLDTGAAKIGVFGSALESLGPIGIGAAVGIGAVVAAFAGAREATKFADDIADTANKLHVTTDALQEYRYAIRAAGGEEAGADDALESFSETLGKAQAGLPKAAKAFKELGFTKAQINGFTDVDTALDAVTKKIAGLSNVQKDAVIDQLGLKGLKPLIEAGVDEMSRLRDEAHKVGIVMDSELVKRGGDLNDKFETVQKVIDIQLKSSLVDLAPILLGLLGIIGDMARGAADIVDSFRSIENKTNRGVQTELARKLQQYNGGGYTPSEGDKAMASNPALAPLAALHEIAEKMESRADLAKDIARLEKENSDRLGVNAPPIPTSKLDGSKTGGGGGSKHDSTAQFDATADSAVANANRSMLQALLGLTDDLEARANLQKQILDEEAAARAAQSARQRAAIEASNSTDKRQQLADLAKADATEKQTNDILRRGIDAELEIAQADRRLSLQKDTADQQIAELQAQEDLTNDRRERARIEHDIVAIQKAIADAERANLQSARQLRANAASPDGSPVTIVDNGNGQRSADATYALQSQGIDDQYAGPLKQWQQDNEDAVANVQDAYESLAVKGIDGFNQSLTDSIVNAKSFGDAFSGVLKQLEADLIAFELKKLEAGFFGSLFGGGGYNSESPDVKAALHPYIPGNAHGTDNWRGGLTWVGERGKELVNLPRGAQVIPNHRVNSFSPVPAGGGVTHVTQVFQVDQRGAMMTEQVISGFNNLVKQSHDSAVNTSRAMVRKDFGAMSSSYGKLGK